MSRAPGHYRILVLGGYGHFGGRIGRALAADATLIIAGRDAAKAQAAAHALPGAHEGVVLDYTTHDLAQRIRALRAHAVVHTCGPFQGQRYHVALACIEARTNYIDLADGRAFVAGITGLDAAARAAGVLVVSGASTLPALSAAVIDEHLVHFSRLDTIDISIVPGQRTPRGVATLQAVLSYCGKPFQVWENGRWQITYGWQDARPFRYPDFGRRWQARCDVPDLQLFPARYADVKRVRFDAALELALAQGAFGLLAMLVRSKLIKDASRYARFIQSFGRHFDGLGSDVGGMHVGLGGVGQDGKPARLDWHLVARRGHGPEIPCVPAIVVARKLAAGELETRGALACMGLMTLADFGAAVQRAELDIAWRTVFA
ncbi:MAG: saccharopine dehydrogenase [Betaproteobacteria bacterium]|nr:saccharopine dehydrogenase [Betaproteobacteria bacterium]